MLMKKFLSAVLSMAMIMSICTVISPTLTASAQESTSQSDSLYNDFSSWKAEKSKGYYQWIGTWSVEDDSDVAGGKYLRFWHWNNTDNYNPNLFAFVANPTGSATAEGSWQLASNSKYLLTIRYRVNGITTEGNALQLMLAVSAEGKYDIASVVNNGAYIKYVDSGISNTDGWVTATYAVDTSDLTIPKNSNLFLGFRPVWTPDWKGVYNDQYCVDIDYYDINPVSEFPRHMEIDFEKYSIPASGMGAVHNSTNASYTIAEENGDKYLSFSKTGSVKWTASYALLLNPNGKAKDNSEKGSYKMENGAKYRVSFRYKLSSADGSCSGVPVALGYSTTANDINAAGGIWYGNKGVQNAVYAEKNGGCYLLAPTDDWQTFTYDFTMDRIAEYSGSGEFMTPYLCFAAGSNWTAQQSASYNFSIDDISVDKLYAINLVDGDSKTEKYGAPAGLSYGIYSESEADILQLDAGSKTTENYTEHTYTDSNGKEYSAYTATLTRSAWFSDETCTQRVSDAVFTVNGATYYKGVETVVGDEDQVAFTGFDEIHPRTANKPDTLEWGDFWKDDTGLENIGGWQRTPEEAYSGTHSLKNTITATTDSEKRIFYIGSGYEAVLGKSYIVSLYIKGDGKAVKIEVSNGKGPYSILPPQSFVTVTATEEWQRVILLYSTVDPAIRKGADATWVAPLIRISSEENTTIYVDTVSVSELNYNSFCYDTSAERIGTDKSIAAYRVTSSYADDGDAAAVALAGSECTVSERGFLVSYAADSKYLSLENLSTDKAKYIKNVSKKSDFGNSYAYKDGVRTFSARIGGFSADSSESIAVRPYITVDNNGSDIVLYGETYVFAVDGKSHVKKLNGTSYNLVWGDEFGGSSLDSTKWGQENVTGTKDSQHLKHVNGNYSVANGVLSFGPTYDSETKTYYSPQNITSLRTMRYNKGYLEVRVKLPWQTSSNPSIWLRTDTWTDDRRINNGEIDVFETFGVKDILTPNLHVWEKTEYTESTDAYGKKYTASKTVDHPWNYGDREKQAYTLKEDRFYTIGFLWTDDKMIMYIGGEEYARYDLTEAAYKYDANYEVTSPSQASIDEALKNTPMGIIFGSGITTSENSSNKDRFADTIDGITFPMNYQIDYVRLYQDSNGTVEYIK